MNTEDGCKYLESLNLSDGVREQVRRKWLSLQQEMQDKKEAENWWNDKWHTYWGEKQKMYDNIQKRNFREGVRKRVMEMFDRNRGNISK